jgi:peptidoglycan/LPS O-acetylase OafA/YrhL
MFRQTANHDNLASLDVLRGIAILSVLFSHFWPGDLPLSLRVLCGQFGVILFFFLSGFLMDRTYSNESQLARFHH